jgi:hypothetical protein
MAMVAAAAAAAASSNLLSFSPSLVLFPLLLPQARLALDTEAAATRLVVLKLHYPRADLTRIMQRNPHLLLQDAAVLAENAKQVCLRCCCLLSCLQSFLNVLWCTYLQA